MSDSRDSRPFCRRKTADSRDYPPISRSSLGHRGPAVLARPVTRAARLTLVVEVNEVLLPHVPAVPARREAKDLGALHAFAAQAGPRQVLQPVQLHAFQRQDRLLRLGAAAAVVADHAVAADDTVAG